MLPKLCGIRRKGLTPRTGEPTGAKVYVANKGTDEWVGLVFEGESGLV